MRFWVARVCARAAGACGIALLASIGLLALPCAASAHVSAKLFLDEDTLLWTLEIFSDEAGDQIVPACANGAITIDGQVTPFACAGARGPQRILIFAEGGNDTVDTTNVTPQAGFTSVVRTNEGDEVLLDGGSGEDTLIGGPLSEGFNNLGAFEFGVGADVIKGNGGNDNIYGTDGKDKIFGGPGADVIYPAAASDLARGGPGDDFISGEGTFDRSHDRFYGEGGDDHVIGGVANDFLDGGPGADFMEGNGGNDRMYGRAGRDGIFGEGGNDVLFGGPGRDLVNGGPGHNQVHQ